MPPSSTWRRPPIPPDHDRHRTRRRPPPTRIPISRSSWSTTPSSVPRSSIRCRSAPHLSLYSATKYLAGYSDMLGGVAITQDAELIRKMRAVRGMFGNILQPDECWMLDGRLPTVSLRMNRQSKNAQRIAEALHGHKHAQRSHLSHPVHRPRAEAHLPEAVRLSRRHVLHRVPRRQGRRLRFPAPPAASRATPCPWAAWRRWCAIRRAPRTPA